MQSCRDSIYGVIYKIENNINGKVYIGQTKLNFNKRYKSKGKGIERVHRYLTRSKEQLRYYNKYLLDSINKYGIDNFTVIEELDVAFNKEELDLKEIYYIEHFDSFNNGYNLTKGGEGCVGIAGEKNGMFGVHRIGADNPNSKRVICLNNKRVFSTLTEASEHYQVSKSSISQCCNGYYKYTSLDNGNRLTWMFYDDFVDKTDSEIVERIDNIYDSMSVICINTGTRYSSTSEASLKTGIDESNIYRCCTNSRRSAGVLDGEKVYWAYYSDYVNNIEKDPNYYIKKSRVKRVGKSVICTTTGRLFETAKEAGIFYSTDSSGILKCCSGKLKTSGKLEDGTKLSWKYSESL